MQRDQSEIVLTGSALWEFITAITTLCASLPGEIAGTLCGFAFEVGYDWLASSWDDREKKKEYAHLFVEFPAENAAHTSRRFTTPMMLEDMLRMMRLSRCIVSPVYTCSHPCIVSQLAQSITIRGRHAMRALALNHLAREVAAMRKLIVAVVRKPIVLQFELDGDDLRCAEWAYDSEETFDEIAALLNDVCACASVDRILVHECDYIMRVEVCAESSIGWLNASE